MNASSGNRNYKPTPSNSLFHSISAMLSCEIVKFFEQDFIEMRCWSVAGNCNSTALNICLAAFKTVSDGFVFSIYNNSTLAGACRYISLCIIRDSGKKYGINSVPLSPNASPTAPLPLPPPPFHFHFLPIVY